MTLARRTPLKRSWIKRRAPKRKGPRHDSPYMAFVRGLACSAADMGRCYGRIDAHHAGPRPGVGLKAHDRSTIPLCRRHHDDLHALRGAFKDFDKDLRRAWAAERIAAVQLAATPEDLGQAAEFEAAGLGRMECNAGVWAWVPGPAEGGAA